MWLHFRDRLANESNTGGVSDLLFASCLTWAWALSCFLEAIGLSACDIAGNKI